MESSKRLQIAFVATGDARDRKNLSGVPFYLSKLLDEYCGDIHYIHDFRPRRITIEYLLKNIFNGFTAIFFKEKIKQLFWRIFNKRYDWERTLAFAKYYSAIIQNKLKERHYDLIFAERSSVQIAFLSTDIPILYESDTTFNAMLNYYPNFTSLPKIAVKTGNILEKMALNKARFFICTSEWTADSAIKDYGISREKIRVLSLPAFVDEAPSRDIVLRHKKRDICELLFMGVDWVRKGGRIAVDAVNELNKHGVNAKLNIVCGEVPINFFNKNNVQIFGYLDKNKEEDRKKIEELFLRSHFLILPTQAECGVANVFLDATAYGLPIVTTNTGGISSAVYDQENGIMLDVGAPGIVFAAAIKKIWEDNEKYGLMRQNARRIFEEKFTDGIWVSSINKVIEDTVGRR